MGRERLPPSVASAHLRRRSNLLRHYRGRVPFALALTMVLAALAVFQLALVFGAPLGRFAWGGQHRVLPPRLRVGSAVSILIYALICLIAWDRVGAINLFPAPFSEVAMWVIFAY